MKKEDAAAASHSMLENNYFDIFQLPQTFEIDKDLLYKNYLILQKNFHPDKIINRSNAEKIQAHEYSAKLNEIYRILNDDKTRAEYILSLNNVLINCDNSNLAPSQEVLMEILELSEDKNEEIISKLKNECWIVFKEFYSTDLNKAAQAIIKLQYLSKL